jgi:glycolate oxidase
LLIQTDGYPAQVEEEAQKIESICKQNQATEVKVARTQEEADNLAQARRVALAALARRKPTTILEDATVPRSKVPEMLAFIDETRKKYNLDIGTFGHAGDGNLHPTCHSTSRNGRDAPGGGALLKSSKRRISWVEPLPASTASAA